MHEQSLLQQAIAAAQAGHKAEARQMLEQILQANPYNEQAWLWMSNVVETDTERIGCLQQAVALNPDNAAARQTLAQLQGRADTPRPGEQPTPGASSDHPTSEADLWPIPEPPAPERREKPKPRSKGLLIALGVLLALGLIGLCGFGASIAYKQFIGDRTAAPTTGPVAIQMTDTPTGLAATTIPPTQQSSPTSNPQPTPTPIPTHKPAPTATPIPVATPIPSSTPCPVAAAPRFAAAWEAHADQLGCALNQAYTQEAASQDFERGFLLWRMKPDQVYVMYDDGELGLYPMSVYPESMRRNPPGADPSIVPPSGRIQPVRGFGLVWRDNPEVRDGVGWALENEARADVYYKFVVQDFVGGAIIHECRIGVRILLHNGTWIQAGDGEPCG